MKLTTKQKMEKDDLFRTHKNMTIKFLNGEFYYLIN